MHQRLSLSAGAACLPCFACLPTPACHPDSPPSRPLALRERRHRREAPPPSRSVAATAVAQCCRRREASSPWQNVVASAVAKRRRHGETFFHCVLQFKLFTSIYNATPEGGLALRERRHRREAPPQAPSRSVVAMAKRRYKRRRAASPPSRSVVAMANRFSIAFYISQRPKGV